MRKCKERGELTSNIALDPEMTKRFQREATRAAGALYSEFLDVYTLLDVEDVVGECWCKVCHRNISYDSTKGAKFESYVMTIVKTTLLDLRKGLGGLTPKGARKERIPNSAISYLSSPIPGNTENITLGDVLEDERGYQDYVKIEEHYDLMSCVEKLNRVPELEELVRMKVDNYTSKEIQEVSSLNATETKNSILAVGQMYKRLLNDECEFLGDILFGDLDTLEKRRDYLLLVTGFMVDTDTGVTISNLIKMILNDFTYSQISTKLNISIGDIKRIIRKYENVAI